MGRDDTKNAKTGAIDWDMLSGAQHRAVEPSRSERRRGPRRRSGAGADGKLGRASRPSVRQAERRPGTAGSRGNVAATMTAEQYVKLLVQGLGVPREKALESSRRLRRAEGWSLARRRRLMRAETWRVLATAVRA
jgi:hypothetical protein